MGRILVAFIFFQLFIFNSNAQIQETEQLRVFLDCNARNCDFSHFRLQIPWVNWVRDRMEGEVHLLITDQRTGGNGLEYILDFLVEEESVKEIKFQTDPTDTDAEIRDQLTNRIALGLIQFVENTGTADNISLFFDATDQPQESDLDRDPWNLWVFRLGARGSVEGEAFQSAYSFRGDLNVTRVDEDLKIIFDGDADYDYQEFDDTDSDAKVTNFREYYSFQTIAVWSLNSQWSAGGTAQIDRSTFSNRDVGVFAGPVIEYNFYPYSEFTRRAFLIRYGTELAYFDYELTTVLGVDQEMLGRHFLRAEMQLQQTWGEVFAFVEGIQYFHDPGTHRINTLVDVEYRLFRGLNVGVFARYSRIKDQFFLPAEGLSPEEILLRRRQRETDFRFDVGLSVSYRFGSMFANVVNPRID